MSSYHGNFSQPPPTNPPADPSGNYSTTGAPVFSMSMPMSAMHPNHPGITNGMPSMIPMHPTHEQSRSVPTDGKSQHTTNNNCSRLGGGTLAAGSYIPQAASSWIDREHERSRENGANVEGYGMNNVQSLKVIGPGPGPVPVPIIPGSVPTSTVRKPNLVDHTYHDYSMVPDDLPDDDVGKKKTNGGVKEPFPEKLMEILCRVEFIAIIVWLPHGRSFIIRNPKTLVAEVLPRFFSSSNLQSFTRQLNLWGFKRITKGRDAGAYYHELFLRGKSKLCHRMKRRTKSKGPFTKLYQNPDKEPNFYLISEQMPLPTFNYDSNPPPLPEKSLTPSKRGRKPGSKSKTNEKANTGSSSNDDDEKKEK
mmetsp:Transcript_9250/g.20425  ORF Transcript_9250/g.20425 Transcript_9250/m.20425 type:complete len:363 (-) Transcript_9250:1199-2287(-)